MPAMGLSEPKDEYVSSGYKICPKDYLAKIEHGICTAASVHHLDSIGMDKFRLLSLPIELRRMIYRYYFHYPFEVWETKYRRIEDSEACDIYCLKRCNTQILRVNHQLHDEAKEVLYSDTIWHFGFNSFDPGTAPIDVDNRFLQAFIARPEFRFIQNVTVGVMFLMGRITDASVKKIEHEKRFSINRKLLSKISKTLIQALNLRTLTVLWHDNINQGNWAEKQLCLKKLARIPEKVRCRVIFGREAPMVHFPNPSDDKYRKHLSVQEQAGKTKLNEYLDKVRKKYQTDSQRTSPKGAGEHLALNAVEQPLA